MEIELNGLSCPTLRDTTVGIQRGAEVVDRHPAAGLDLRWVIEARLVEGPDWRGPYVYGRRGARFLYLSWARSNEMFRRAKLMLEAVPEELLPAVEQTGLRATFSLTMPDGSPLCAAVRPPAIQWSAR